VNLATEVAKLTVGVTDVDIAVFPPHPFLVPVYSKIEATNVKLGGQNCYFMSEGAYTGAVSTCMLKDIGVSYVLAGHSERRTLFQDDDGAINKKVKKILKEGLKPVLCIGETKDEYEAGLNHEVRCDASDLSPRPFFSPDFLCRHRLAGVRGAADEGPGGRDARGDGEDRHRLRARLVRHGSCLVLCVSHLTPLIGVHLHVSCRAIGTGLVCPPDVAQEVHAFIRSVVAKKYGAAVANKVRFFPYGAL